MLDMILSLLTDGYKHRFYFQNEPDFNSLSIKDDSSWHRIMTGQPIAVPTTEDLEKAAPAGDRLLEEMGLTVQV